jgi:hypothetical protein
MRFVVILDRRLVLQSPKRWRRPFAVFQCELIAFRRLYGIRECRCKGRCKVEQFGELRATRTCVAEGRSRRLAARLLREVRSNPTSMYQTRCQCAACRQAIPPIPFSAHQLLAKLLQEGETKPRPPRTRPNRNARYNARRRTASGRKAGGCLPLVLRLPPT